MKHMKVRKNKFRRVEDPGPETLGGMLLTVLVGVIFFGLGWVIFFAVPAAMVKENNPFHEVSKALSGERQ